MPDHLLPDTVETITLEDGTELDQRQTQAIMLKVLHDLSDEEIAEQVGYSSRSTVWHFLNSERGKKGVQLAVRQHLLDGARVGLRTMVNLAKSAKSENVRQMAAADLMDRAGLRLEGEANTGGSGREVNIQINIGRDDDGQVIIEGGSAQ